MEQLYGEKCQELEQCKKICSEYENMISSARQEFITLQEKYAELMKIKLAQDQEQAQIKQVKLQPAPTPSSDSQR